MPSLNKSGLVSLKELEDGQLLEGDYGVPPSPPKDFDASKFHRGRLFFREYIFSCSMGMFFSLIVGLCIPNLLESLVFTGNSNTPKKAFKRYIKTFHHIALWHYGNVWQEDSEANKSILSIRKLHRKISIQMKEKENTSKEYLSQYDMGMVQSGFMGTIVMYSYQLGIKCSPSDIDDYVYFWYCIGHLLGIETKYNICAHGISQAFSFCKDIEDIVCRNLESPPPEFYTMADAVIVAFQHSQTFTLITLPVVCNLMFDAMLRKRTRLGLADTIRFYIWKFLFYLLRHFKCFRKFLQLGSEKVFSLTFSPVDI